MRGDVARDDRWRKEQQNPNHSKHTLIQYSGGWQESRHNSGEHADDQDQHHQYDLDAPHTRDMQGQQQGDIPLLIVLLRHCCSRAWLLLLHP